MRSLSRASRVCVNVVGISGTAAAVSQPSRLRPQDLVRATSRGRMQAWPKLVGLICLWNSSASAVTCV